MHTGWEWDALLADMHRDDSLDEVFPDLLDQAEEVYDMIDIPSDVLQDMTLDELFDGDIPDVDAPHPLTPVDPEVFNLCDAAADGLVGDADADADGSSSSSSSAATQPQPQSSSGSGVPCDYAGAGTEAGDQDDHVMVSNGVRLVYDAAVHSNFVIDEKGYINDNAKPNNPCIGRFTTFPNKPHGSGKGGLHGCSMPFTKKRVSQFSVLWWMGHAERWEEADGKDPSLFKAKRERHEQLLRRLPYLVGAPGVEV
jgi:hypothetical protein